MFPARRHRSPMARRSPPKAFGSMIAGRWLTTGAAQRAPKSARRVAFGAARCNGEAENLSDSTPKLFCSLLSPACLYRTKEPVKNFRRGLCRRFGREPMHGCASLINHSNLVMVRSALRSRRFLSRSSAAMASKVLVESAALLVFSARRCWVGSIPSFKTSLGRVPRITCVAKARRRADP